MDCNKQISTTSDIPDSIDQTKSFSTCTVCGNKMARLHYGALCCVSCKMFFRRNAQFDLTNNQCVFDGECDLTINSRRSCRYCRFKKCLVVGMQKELLRASHRHHSRHNKRLDNNSNKKTLSLPCIIHPLDLLQNDRSLLTVEQWSCLSNVISLYNSKSPVSHVRHLLKVQSSQPMKIRSKMASNNILTIIATMYQAILPFIEKITQFANLSLNDRTALIGRSIKNAGGFSGIVICRDADVYHSLTFKIGFPSIYGSAIMDRAVKIYEKTDNDGILIKLLIPVLIFSSSSDLIISRNENEMRDNVSPDHYRLLSNTKYILHIQNLYTEILFKYMIYRFGYEEAALRFAALIKSSLDQSMCALHAVEVQTHGKLMQTIVQETERSLTLRNSISID